MIKSTFRPSSQPNSPSAGFPRRPWAMLGVFAVVLGAAACSSPPPAAEMAASKATVERATSAVAAEAPMELASARDKIERANVAMSKKDYATARRLAAEAEADATLAEARARAVRSDKELAQVRESIRLVREQAADRP